MLDTNREDVVTLFWEIENFNALFNYKIESPVFVSNSLDHTRWKMCLYPQGYDNNNEYDISLSLTRCDSRKSKEHRIVLDCELSIIDEYGDFTLASQQIAKHEFIEDHCWSPCETFVSRSVVFVKRRTDFIPYNVLHVRCRMWRSFDKEAPSELLISRTRIERNLFVFKIDNFSCLKDKEVREVHFKEPFSVSTILSYRFYTDKTNDEAIFELATNESFNISIICEITALDCTGITFHSDLREFTSNNEKNPCPFSLIPLSELLDSKTLYLPMDVLSLRVNCFFWSSDIKYLNVSPIPLPNLKKCECMCERVKGDVNSNTHHNLERFLQDMHSMYEEGLLSDFTLCSGNRTFPVHKNILSARSPVFKAMFTTPLKEMDGKVLDIPDIDGETLHKMLLFVYSNEIGDLEWEDAINLYFAADKYNIEDLKSITCSILKSKLSVSNACQILVHADLHEDQDLKSSAMQFIATHDDEIIGTEDWKKFQKKHIPLAMEILSVLYTEMKKRIGSTII